MAILWGVLVPRWLRLEGRDAAIDGIGQIAWLAGGDRRFADAITVRLLARGALSVTRKGSLQVDRRDDGNDAIECRILSLSQPLHARRITVALWSDARAVEQDLVSAGLAMGRWARLGMRLAQSLPALLLVLNAATLWRMAGERCDAAETPKLLLIIALLIVVVRFVRLDRCTRAGQRELAQARKRADRLRRAPTVAELDLGVALFGTVVLIGSPWTAFHRPRAEGDGGCGGGCGGGGCGGGCGC